MFHSGIGLPEREYYRRTDGEFPNIRAAYQAHIERMLTFVDTLANWYDQVKALPKPTLVALMKMGGKIARFVAKVA